MKKQLFILAALTIAFMVPISAQWTTAPSGTLLPLNTAWQVDASIINVGGDAATLLHSTDAGASFAPVGFAGDDVNEMQFVDAMNGYAVGDNGRFLTTSNAGASWSVSFVGTGSNLRGLHFRDASNGHVVGNDGVIFKTDNGGLSWTAQSSGTFERIEAVHFLDANNGYAAAREDTWLSTTNGGASWSVSSLVGGGRDLNDVHFVDATTGFVASDNGIILRTTDAGANWTTVSGGLPNDLNKIYFSDASNGYAVGELGTIRVTSDGGSTWAAEASSTFVELNDIHLTASGAGVIVGDGGLILIKGASDPCGTAVTGLSTTLTSGADFSWTAVPTATAYQIEGGISGAPASRLVITNNSLSIGAGFFTPGSTYDWRIRAQCADGSVSPWSAISSFTVPLLRIQSVGNVFPNPTVNHLNVSLTETAQHWQISDLSGRVLLSGKDTGVLQIDVSSFETGTYLFSAENINELFVKN